MCIRDRDGTITSTQSIIGGPIEYDSGIYVDLNPGFNTILGVDFHAFIDGCGGAMMPGGGQTQMIETGNEHEASKDLDKQNE